jgi:hypothetical protein
MTIEAETTAIALSSKTTYTGGAVSVGGLVLSNETLGLIGLGVALLGLIVNFYFAEKKDRREEKEHALRMRELESHRVNK